jgi:hypothetical protein
MTLRVRSAAWLLPFMLSGCFQLPFHRSQPPETRTLAPRITPSQTIDLVAIDLPPEDMVVAAYSIINLREDSQPIHPPVKHRRSNPDEAAVTPDSTPAPTSEVNAIGQLTTGDPADFRQQTQDSIASIERRLNGINRPLSDSEQRTADHIREFLKQAKTAMASGDVEGAHTLADKAQVLLAELTK